MSSSVRDRYQQLVEQGHLERDAAQEDVIARLDAAAEAIVRGPGDQRTAGLAAGLGRLFGAKPAPTPVPGLYIWGAVGRGKTMLMDLFFASVPIERKRRAHFHAFMADVHARVHAWRQALKRGEVQGDEPIAPVADALAEDATLLCFDEFAVTDIADAMILGRLFKALFAHGVILVATSNVAPNDLYKDGLNRALFLPFIELLGRHVEVLRLEARTDFRLEKLSGEPVFHMPADAAAREALDRAFRKLSGRDHGDPVAIEVLGRKLEVPQAADGIARFGFADLCEQPHAAADFLAIAQRFHTVVIDAIPVIAAEQRNIAKRFITLIDTLYDRHVKLVASAAAEPAELYAGTDTREAFEFQRTASRLVEMQSTEYLAMPHGRADSKGSGDSSGIAET